MFSIGLVYWSTTAAGLIHGLIAYGVGKHLDGAHGIEAWQWLFIVEGVPTVALGAAVILIMPSMPDRVVKTGHWLFRNTDKHRLLSRTKTGKMRTFWLRRVLVTYSSTNSPKHHRRENRLAPGHHWTKRLRAMGRCCDDDRPSHSRCYSIQPIHTYIYTGSRVRCSNASAIHDYPFLVCYYINTTFLLSS